MSAANIQEMMKNWIKIESKVRETFPAATEEEIYAFTKQTMNKSLGL